MLSHLSGASLVLEFERLNKVSDPFFFQRELTGVLNNFQKSHSLEELSQQAAKLARKMFDYDRVMVYRFDEEWNGKVIAEIKNDDMESWLGLNYPATDIPEQSRKLFLKHRVRMISNVKYKPVQLVPEISPLTAEPLDISKSGLRAVSPVHIEYLQNMGVGASLSAAIVVKGKLWGLLACHNNDEKYLDYYQRESCRFLVQMFSSEITLHETNILLEKSKVTESIRGQLVVQMGYEPDVIKALSRETVKFVDLVNCGGGAIFFEGQWELNGRTPSIEQLDQLLKNFIAEQSKSIFSTRNLSALFPEAYDYKNKASGLLSLKIAENNYILWFKPEVVEEVTWGGNPQNKGFFNEKEQRLSPRKSFEKWREKSSGFSEAWYENDTRTIRTFRENISHVLLSRQRKEIEKLNKELLEANKELELFSYGLSHDLRAPVRGVEGFFEILHEDHSNRLSEEAIEILRMGKGLTEKMHSLIDGILQYSKLGHVREVKIQEVDTDDMIREVLNVFNIEKDFPRVIVKVQPNLPQMKGEKRMLFQLWMNLVSNALKYSSAEEGPLVELGSCKVENREVFFIKDNGIGVNPDFKEKIFQPFQRAVGNKFRGTGIGLAIVKRIVEIHKGEVWVKTEVGKGSEFYFYLQPQREENKK
jgi:light-regulated signal transduction histidine kinase (bacteriophytochrome)